jgi:hypothetical protein
MVVEGNQYDCIFAHWVAVVVFSGDGIVGLAINLEGTEVRASLRESPACP